MLHVLKYRNANEQKKTSICKKGCVQYPIEFAKYLAKKFVEKKNSRNCFSGLDFF